MSSGTAPASASQNPINADATSKRNIGSSKTNEPLESLRLILEKQSHLFACGGSVSVHDESEKSSRAGDHIGLPMLPSEQRTSGPVTIRWDAGDATNKKSIAACTKLSLPLPLGAETEVDRLVKDTQPATFGRGGQDVYDESYRKALQMDPSAFCTTFDPYSLGIIDAVAQILLPSVSASTTHRAVRAELYKLNVYSGPSGRFKPHVDTPRSRFQFGSLVVCLPAKHEGGQLKVRHKEEEMTFEWGTAQNSIDHTDIRWAAFYSDCEHEVLEVTSGHRITLTYNLYAVRGAGRLTGVFPMLNPVHLPLFNAVKAMLCQNPFGGRGGILGFWCSHAYAYNHETEAPLPATLKGVDAVLWESFQALNLEPKIAPVIEMSDEFRKRLSEIYDDADLLTYPWVMRLRERMPPTMPLEWIVGHSFGVQVIDKDPKEPLDIINDMFQHWGAYTHEPIQWLTKPGESEMQLAYTAYGNQASTEIIYSHCAILVTIPPNEP